jgi:hypothetical protein
MFFVDVSSLSELTQLGSGSVDAAKAHPKEPQSPQRPPNRRLNKLSYEKTSHQATHVLYGFLKIVEARMQPFEPSPA